MRRRTRTFAVLALASMALTVTATSAHGQLLEAATLFMPGPGGTFEITTGFVRVPELRVPEGQPTRTIELAVVRVRRAGAATHRSAHVMLAGGPGDSGVNLAIGLVRQGGPAVWELFDGDVIGIDQRGSGRSRPNLDTPVRFDLPLDKPGSIEEWLPRIREPSRKVAEEFRARGIRLEAYNTRESAHDVADVLRALGYGRTTLWGRSYGSHLALATLALYPTLGVPLDVSAHLLERFRENRFGPTLRNQDGARAEGVAAANARRCHESKPNETCVASVDVDGCWASPFLHEAIDQTEPRQDF